MARNFVAAQAHTHTHQAKTARQLDLVVLVGLRDLGLGVAEPLDRKPSMLPSTAAT